MAPRRKAQSKSLERPDSDSRQPAIILRSTSIRLRSTCYHLRSPCVQSPHTPMRVAGPAFGLGGLAWLHPKEGKGGQKGRQRAQCHHARVESRNRRMINSATAPRRSRQGRHSISTTDRQPCQCWRAGRPGSKALAITACADTVQTRESGLCDNAAFIGISGNRPHDGKSRERVLGAATEQAAARACAISEATVSATEAPANGKPHPIEIIAKMTVEGTGVGGTCTSQPIIDLILLHSAALCEIFGRFFSENLGAGQGVGKDDAAPTQPWLSIAPRVLSARVVALGERTHQRAISESRRGMSP
jgi:hypothetical protein